MTEEPIRQNFCPPNRTTVGALFFKPTAIPKRNLSKVFIEVWISSFSAPSKEPVISITSGAEGDILSAIPSAATIMQLTSWTTVLF